MKHLNKLISKVFIEGGGWHVNTIVVIGGFPPLIPCASIANVVEPTCTLIAGSTRVSSMLAALFALSLEIVRFAFCALLWRSETELLLLILPHYLVSVHCQCGKNTCLCSHYSLVQQSFPCSLCCQRHLLSLRGALEITSFAEPLSLDLRVLELSAQTGCTDWSLHCSYPGH